jgi:polysaccharide pyruvyl transferase WcaK-like protein
MPAKILVANLFNTSNHGEMLSLGTLAKLLKGSMTVACPYSIIDEERLPQGIKYAGKRSRSMSSITFYPRMLLNMLFLVREIRRSDVIVDLGGDTISDSNGLIYTLAHCTSLILAHIFSKPVIVLPQTIEPFRHGLSKSVAKLALNNCLAVFVREPETFDYLKSQGIKVDRVMYDQAFYSDPLRKNSPNDNNCITIGVNCSRYMYDAGTRCYPELIDTLQKHSSSLLYIPHVIGDERRSDCILSLELARRHGGTIILADAERTRKLISTLTMFVGQRYHSIVSALSTCTPTIAVSDAYKTKALMKRMGLADYMINPHDPSFKTRLEETVQAALDNRKAIRSHLTETIPQVRNDILKMFEEVNACIGTLRQLT